jgi:hypothetical protein
MANWINGHNDQFGFKAIVCHDGIFDTTDAFYTTEVWLPGVLPSMLDVGLTRKQELWFPKQ